MEHGPMINVRDLSTLEGQAPPVRPNKLIEASHPARPALILTPIWPADVIRKAKALRTSLNSLRQFLIPNEKETNPCK